MSAAEHPAYKPLFGHHRPHEERILQAVDEGRYCVVLGSRFAGKSFLLGRVCQHLANDPDRICLRIDLYQANITTAGGFFDGLIAEVAANLQDRTGVAPPVSFSEGASSRQFHNFLLDNVHQMKEDLVVLIDHLEVLPKDLLQSLLRSLRAAYMESVGMHAGRLMVVLAGALSLAPTTVGETSPLHNIAVKVWVGEMSAEQSAELIDQLLRDQPVKVTPAAREELLRSAGGVQQLLRWMCRRCVALAQGTASRRLSVKTVRRAEREFLRDKAPHDDPLQDAIRQIEEQPDLVRCVVRLLDAPLVLRSELPLPMSTELDPLMLTGMVSRQDDSYRLRNNIYRRYLAHHFTPGRVGHLLTVHGRWDAAMKVLQDSLLSGSDEYRNDLLAASINAAYAAPNLEKAASYLVRAIAAAFRSAQVRLWYLLPDTSELKIISQVGLSGDGALTLFDTMPVSDDRLEARAFSERRVLRSPETSGGTVRVYPLQVAEDTALGVVSLSGDEAGTRDRELQLLGYLSQAARALHAVGLRLTQKDRIDRQNQELEKRAAELSEKAQKLSLLHRVSTLVQTMDDLERMLHLVLTCVTANFGLKFNRAWLFTLNAEGAQFTGQVAIGDFDRQQAFAAWERTHDLTFERYVEDLFSGAAPDFTSLHEATKGLRLPVQAAESDPFSRAVAGSRVVRWQRRPGDPLLEQHEFFRLFDPGDMVVAPLLAHQHVLGVIAVDRKFEPHPLTQTDEELLSTFANQAAAAIVSQRERDREHRQLQMSEILRQISTQIGQEVDLQPVLKTLLKAMGRVLPFDSASIQLENQAGDALQIIAATGFEDNQAVEQLSFPLSDDYPNVVVFQQKRSQRFGRVAERYPHFADPHFFVDEVNSWMGAPLVIGDQVIGVITCDKRLPDYYTAEHEDLALMFAGQAAVALHKANLLEQERQSRQDLRKVLETLQIVAQETSLEAGLTELARQLVDLVGVSCGLTLLLEPNGDAFSVAAAYPVRRTSSQPLAWSPGASRTVQMQGATQIMRSRLFDLASPKVFRAGQSPPGWDVVEHVRQVVGLNGPLASLLAIPLRVGTNTIGVCILGEMRAWTRSPFSQERIDLAASIAGQAVHLINRMRAEDFTRRRMEQLEVLRQIGAEVSGMATDATPSMSRRIAEGACQVLGADCAVVYPYQQDLGLYDVRKIGAYGLRAPDKRISTKFRPDSHSLANLLMGPGGQRQVVVDDVESGTDRSGQVTLEKNRFIRREDVKAFIGLGLFSGQEPVGTLFVNFRQPHQFQPDELERVEIFANQAAVTLRQARLFERAQKEHHALEATRRITRLIGATEALHPVWQAILDGALAVTGAEFGRVMLRAPDDGRYVSEVTKGLDENGLRRLAQHDQETCELVQRVLDSHKSELILDTSGDNMPECCRRVNQGVEALLATPILLSDGDETPGVILLGSSQRGAFSADDNRLLDSLAAYAGIAIDSARRYAEIREFDRMRDSLLRTAQRMTMLPLQSDDTLKWVADSVREYFDCDIVTLYVHDQSRTVLEKPAVSGTLYHPDQMRRVVKIIPETLVGKLFDLSEPYFADDSPQDEIFGHSAFTQREDVRSTAGIPLLFEQEKVGALFLNYRRQHSFTERERKELELFATYAATATHNAHLFDRQQRRAANLKALYQTAKEIATRADHSRDQILESTLKQAMLGIATYGPKASFGNLMRYEPETNELVNEILYPPDSDERFPPPGFRLPLDPQKAPGGRTGIVGRAVRKRQLCNVQDVDQDADFVRYHPDTRTRSELAVPLLDGERLLGVLNLESDEVDAFDEDDQETLQALADLAVVALTAAEHYQELTRTKDELVASQAVAWLGLFGAEWQHTINQKTFSIRNYAAGMQRFIEQQGLPEDVVDTVLFALSGITGVVDRIREVQFTSNVPAAGKASGTTEIDVELPAIVKRWSSDRQDVEIAYDLNCSGLQVGIDPQWLKVAMEKLVSNALKAMPDGGRLALRTQQVGQQVEITVQDSGPGIPEAIRPYFLKQHVPRENKSNGTGMGVLIARFIALSHGGALWLVETGSTGTTLCLTLPLVSPTSLQDGSEGGRNVRQDERPDGRPAQKDSAD